MTTLLVVMTNPVEGREDEYNEWYTHQHLADVLAVEGFVAAQRFEFQESPLSRKPPAKYLAIYEVEDDKREQAEKILLEVATTDKMPISDAMDPKSLKWWFSSICDKQTAG